MIHAMQQPNLLRLIFLTNALSILVACLYVTTLWELPTQLLSLFAPRSLIDPSTNQFALWFNRLTPIDTLAATPSLLSPSV